MTNDEINTEIVELCGWRWVPNPKIKNPRRDVFWVAPGKLGEMELEEWKHGATDSKVPNYCEDLNWMNDAENVLNGEQIERYINYLMNIAGPAVVFQEFIYIPATALQRAEAFLRTLGKWKV